MAGSCETSAGSCETQAGSACCSSSASGCESKGGCGCGSQGCGGDPIDTAAGMWAGAFFQAMKQAQVELLKGKIQKAWGAKMDKAADAVIDAMGTHWQSSIAQAKAKADFKEKLRGLWQEGGK